MRVLLVTSWGTACGIAAYAELLKQTVEEADPGIEVIPSAEALDPLVVLRKYCTRRDAVADKLAVDVIHLNHHDALHSRWSPECVSQLQRRVPVLITYHDTRAGVPGQSDNSDKLKAFAQVASSVVVHEPVADLKAIYWRQGVPPPATGPWRIMGGNFLYFLSHPQQPVLGTIGFAFPWKNYDRLCQLTAEEGWAFLLLANDATPADQARWKQLNPHSTIWTGFLPQDTATNLLAMCDATVFMYECQNNGTSGAIRQGIAARKPVIAHQGCRQFRDLYEDPLGREAIQWVGNWDELRETLRRIPSTRFDPMIHALAERDSWTALGRNYSKLYRVLVGVGGSTV